MKIAGIFKVLIIIVVCVALGALTLNIVMPNAVKAGFSAVEDSIFKATAFSFDINGDGVYGSASNTQYGGDKSSASDSASDGIGVDGFN